MDKQKAKQRPFERPDEVAKKTDKKSNDDNNDKKLNTDTLDEVMNEFIQICNQYNQKLSLRNDKLNASSSSSPKNKPCQFIPNDNTSISSGCSSMSSTMLNNKCDINDKNPSSSGHMLAPGSEHRASSSNAQINIETIESLQAQQCEAQAQLDQVLHSLQVLKSKQTRKLESIYEDEGSNERDAKHSVSSNDQVLSDDDDELLEFQQIENELRISELTRQLDLIQEKIRLKLYKRLISHSQSVASVGDTSVGVIKQQRLHTLSSGRRGSHSDESSPSSSSFSDDLVPSSVSPANELPSESSKTVTVNGYPDISKSSDDSTRQQQQQERPQTVANQEQVQGSKIFNMLEKTNTLEAMNRKNILTSTSIDINREITNPEQKVDSVDSARTDLGQIEVIDSNIRSDTQRNNGQTREAMPAQNIFTNCSSQYVANCNVFRGQGHIGMYEVIGTNNYARINDLERIDEGELEEEEEEEENIVNDINEEDKLESHYHSPKQLRSIYQESISPLLHASQATNGHNNILAESIQQHKALNEIGLGSSARDKTFEESLQTTTTTTRGDHENSFNENSLIAKSHRHNTSNRPLTLYLPKPDEEINLMDHIQRIGHDLELISNDIKLSHSSASGYLWKCCSNNDKKWLKRYFYFDRKSKVFAYYDNEFELVKKNKSNTDYCLPEKRCIPFEDINDVYVEHRLSLGSNDSGKKKSTNKTSNGGRYVFVLSTVGRRFMLATRKPESLRAWVDILFTAARANDFDLDQFADQQKPTGELAAASGGQIIN